jgi:hypothetical protein
MNNNYKSIKYKYLKIDTIFQMQEGKEMCQLLTITSWKVCSIMVIIMVRLSEYQGKK